jgi:hypothetical protein
MISVESGLLLRVNILLNRFRILPVDGLRASSVLSGGARNFAPRAGSPRVMAGAFFAWLGPLTGTKGPVFNSLPAASAFHDQRSLPRVFAGRGASLPWADGATKQHFGR